MDLQISDIRDTRWLICAGVWFLIGDVLMIALIWRIRCAIKHGWLGNDSRQIGAGLISRLRLYVGGSLFLVVCCVIMYCVRRPFDKYDWWLGVVGAVLLLSRLLKFVRILGMLEYEHLHSNTRN